MVSIFTLIIILFVAIIAITTMEWRGPIGVSPSLTDDVCVEWQIHLSGKEISV